MWKTVKTWFWEWRGVLLTAPTISILIIVIRLLGGFQILELASFDLYMRLRPMEKPDQRIAIVGITQKDIQRKNSSTFSDQVYAKLLTKLKAMKPRAIGLDIYRDVPIEPGTSELNNIFKNSPNIIGITKVIGNKDIDVIPPPPNIKYAGSNDLLLDPVDQKIRRTILTYQPKNDKTYYAFGLLLALMYLEGEGIKVKALPQYQKWWQIQGKILRKVYKHDGGYVNVDDGSYQILLNYRGSNNHFDLVSISDVLEDKIPQKWGKDRIILIGHVAESSGDFFFTPYSITPSQRMYGVEIHANIASQILSLALDNRPLIRTTSDLIFLFLKTQNNPNFDGKINPIFPELLDGIWTFFWALLASILTWCLRYTQKANSFASFRLIFVFFVAIVLILTTFVAFVYSWWIPVIPPLFALGGSAIAITAYMARMAGDIRNTFGRYLSNEIVATLLESPEGLKLGGERKKITILTSDLRGFTATSERLPPEEVVKIINFYLGYMADVITKYNGTIDEFMGDGILVLFGAPIARHDDAKRAIACAIEMQLAMKLVNEQMKKWNLPPLEMGIGINTGEVVVGNIGSEKRSKYGVVGSQVNLTYRIESYTIGGQIVISETTMEEANANLKLVGQREVSPKGVKKAITIYEIGGIEDEYNLFLPEDQEIYVNLTEAIKLQYSVLEGKDISQEITLGEIVELSEKGAKIQIKLAQLDQVQLLTCPKPLTNIKINLLDQKQTVNSEDLYGKVLEKPADQGYFFIRFTAVSPDLKQQLGEIYQALLKHKS